jgi:hypothetical protein
MLVPRPIPMEEERPERLQKVRRASGVTAPAGFPAKAERLAIPANTHATLLLDQTYLTTAYPELQVSGGRDAVVRLHYAESLFLPNKEKGNRDEVEGKEGEKVALIEDSEFLSSQADETKKQCAGCGCDAGSAKCKQCEAPLCGMCEAESGRCEKCEKGCPVDWCPGCDNDDDSRCHCGECSLVACCNWARTDGLGSSLIKKPEKSAHMRTMKPSDREELTKRIYKARELVAEMATKAPKIHTEYGLEQMAKLAQRVLDACNKKKK